MELNEISILPMNFSHLNSIKDILESEFDNFWSYNVFKSELSNPNSKYFIASFNNQIIGFAGILLILDEADITNIVVKKDFRGHRISTLLLTELINFCAKYNYVKINLEVASSNTIALNLYKNFGFTQVGLRKRYYNNSDAILMSLYIKNKSDLI